MHPILKNSRARVGAVTVAGLALAGVGLAAAPANAASESVWDRVAACESGGNWHIDTGNGYYGGLQFSASTWRAYGGSGLASNASKSEQIRIAERVLAGQGWGAWPVCSVQAGATGSSSSVSTSPATTHASSAASSSAQPARHVAPVKLSGKTYRVNSGDTLSTIAERLKVTGGWSRLADANASTISDPNLIYPGQVLRLPA